MRRQVAGAGPHFDDLRLGLARRWGGLPRSLAQSAQNALYASEKLPWIERFRYVVIRAHFQTDDTIDGLSGSSQHDDSDRVGSPQIAGKCQAILPREIEIHQNYFDRSVREDLSHTVAVACDRHVKAAKFEIVSDRVANVLIVVDDENSSLRRHGGRRRFARVPRSGSATAA